MGKDLIVVVSTPQVLRMERRLASLPAAQRAAEVQLVGDDRCCHG